MEDLNVAVKLSPDNVDVKKLISKINDEINAKSNSSTLRKKDKSTTTAASNGLKRQQSSSSNQHHQQQQEQQQQQSQNMTPAQASSSQPTYNIIESAPL